MKRAALYSAIFHGVLFVLLIIGFRNPFQRASLSPQTMMIEVTEIREVSTAPQLAPEAQEPEKKQAQKIPPESTPKQPEPPKSQALQKPETPNKPLEEKTEPVEEEAIPLQKPKKEPLKPRQEPKEKKEKSQPKKAEVNLSKKQNPAKEKTKDKEDKAFDNLLDDVLQEDADNKPAKTSQGAPAAKVGAIMSTSEMDALRRQIYKCWIVPAGARGAKDLIVDVDMEIGRDGTVLKATVADAKRMDTDSYYRAAGESARRAVLDPKCNPLPLPPDKYDQWKQLTLSFNPKDMF